MHRHHWTMILGLLALLAVTGCALKKPKPPEVVFKPFFPPQKVMDSGEFESFFTENEQASKGCPGGENCETTMFNLGFTYAYSQSPYYNRLKAIKHFEKLIEQYPQSPLSYQARVWVDLLKKSVATEISHRTLRTKLKSRTSALKAKDSEIKSKETAIGELQEQMQRARDTDLQLQEQIQRARDIDLQIDKKERELLQ